MIHELLRDGLTRSLGAALMSRARLDEALRSTLERYELPEAEIECIVSEARANLERWQGEVGGELAGAVGVGVGAGWSVLLRSLGVPGRDEIAALERRVAELESRPSARKPAARKRAPRTT